MLYFFKIIFLSIKNLPEVSTRQEQFCKSEYKMFKENTSKKTSLFFKAVTPTIFMLGGKKKEKIQKLQYYS